MLKDGKTEIEGLRFERNIFTNSPDESYFTVLASEGPGISDVVTHGPNFGYNHYGIHVAQTDRLTFLGDPTQKITGHFVDCRKGSPTLHHALVLEYFPDPKRRLHIDRGIAHTFDGLQNIVTRDEPEWFLSSNNPDYNIANDVVNVARDVPITEFPVVQVNEFPIPRQAYEFMLGVQHVSMKEMRRYPTRFPMIIDGKKRYVSLRPKETEVSAS